MGSGDVMIYTVTLNPAVDYVVKVPELVAGRVNRTAGETLYPGGKGINVSILLAHLGIESRALGFIAGFTGDEIARLLEECGCQTDFIRLREGLSRINVKIQSGGDTEINAKGPGISQEDLACLYEKLSALKENDLLVLAGSVPASVPEDVYEQILSSLEGKGVLSVVDAAGTLLKNVLKYRPFLIKPNHHELGELFGVALNTPEEIKPYAEKLQQMGARNVLVSMGGDGAVCLCENGEFLVGKPPKGVVKNTVGSGDSMVAGFLAGYLTERTLPKAFLKGIAAGSASAFSPWLASGEEVERLYLALQDDRK